jgi:ketosteroid isomerase-like protein
MVLMTEQSTPDAPPAYGGGDHGHDPVKHRSARSWSARIVLLVGACSLALGLVLGAVGAHALWRPAASPAQANPAQATAQQWLAALKAKNLDAMEALFAPDGTWEDGAIGDKSSGGPKAEEFGWEAVLATVQTVKDTRILGLGDGVAIVAYTLYATPPSRSTPTDIPFVTVLHVRDGHISAETIYYNTKVVFGS